MGGSNIKLIALLLAFAAAFSFSYAYSKRLLDWLRFQSLGTRDYVVEKLNLMFYEAEPNKVLLGMLLISLLPGLLIFVAFLPNFAPGIIFGSVMCVVGWKAPKPIVDWLYQRRVDKFVIQMIDGLGLMSNGMKSGLSVVQSLGLVVQEMPDPIQQEFNLILSQNKLGVSVEEAFVNLSKRIRSDDVEMFVTSVNILKETGGNLAETFDTIVNTIRERIKVESKIKALTAQGFYQGVVVVMIPPMMGFALNQQDPELMKPLFTTPIGWAIIMVIVILEVVGFFAIMKIVKIDV